jgi:16S rRNA (guanine527-N7)-methyltransferase
MREPYNISLIQQYFSEFTPEQDTQLRQLGPLYEEWNAKINVISRKDIDALYEKHVLHSLAIAAIFDFSLGGQMEILDIGTGGGFPGIPLAIMFPNVQFTLADSIAKKLKVVDAVAEGIGLTNVTTRHTRVEDIKDKKFDFIVSRAVAPLKDLWKWGKPLIRADRKLEAYKNGMIFLKGGDLAAEISESRLRPYQWDIHDIFPEEWYREKYLLYVPS